MKELIERLREDYCSCIDGYKSRGMTDPQCSSCDSKDWREECADALESLTKALDFWKNGHIEMTAELFAVKRAQDTAVDEYIKSEEKVIALTAELARISAINAGISDENAALRADAERLNKIAHLIGSIFVYGGFKAETHNETELEKLLRENGTFWESVPEYESAIGEKK